MPKAAVVLAALKRDGWVQVRQRGSHRRLVKGPLRRTWAFHDGIALGNIQVVQVARQFRLYKFRLYIGYTLDELRKLF
jgi:predicted RNA binding protein YcfA (HicA-like mRNA interferase family)